MKVDSPAIWGYTIGFSGSRCCWKRDKGAVASRDGISTALVYAGAGTVAMTSLSFVPAAPGRDG